MEIGRYAASIGRRINSGKGIGWLEGGLKEGDATQAFSIEVGFECIPSSFVKACGFWFLLCLMVVVMVHFLGF